MQKREIAFCEVERCQSQATYALYKTFPNGEKKWIKVCRRHEQLIGKENLERASVRTKMKGAGS